MKTEEKEFLSLLVGVIATCLCIVAVVSQVTNCAMTTTATISEVEKETGKDCTGFIWSMGCRDKNRSVADVQSDDTEM